MKQIYLEQISKYLSCVRQMTVIRSSDSYHALIHENQILFMFFLNYMNF